MSNYCNFIRSNDNNTALIHVQINICRNTVIEWKNNVIYLILLEIQYKSKVYLWYIWNNVPLISVFLSTLLYIFQIPIKQIYKKWMSCMASVGWCIREETFWAGFFDISFDNIWKVSLHYFLFYFIIFVHEEDVWTCISFHVTIDFF